MEDTQAGNIDRLQTAIETAQEARMADNVVIDRAKATLLSLRAEAAAVSAATSDDPAGVPSPPPSAASLHVPTLLVVGGALVVGIAAGISSSILL